MAEYSRRSFVGFCVATAAFAGFGGTVHTLEGAQQTDLVRPPGGQEELAFTAACLKCDRCRSVCHSGAISVATVGDGFLKARTPKLDFHQGSCDFCGACTRVCATGALGAFDASHDGIGTAIVQADRCAAYYNSCTECFKACPYQAISLDASGVPVVDPHLCNGCGVCENICPALIYRSFAGGTRRGIVVVSPSRYRKIGKTTVADESEMTAS